MIESGLRLPEAKKVRRRHQLPETAPESICRQRFEQATLNEIAMTDQVFSRTLLRYFSKEDAIVN